jgi:hypothetical protein
MNGPANTYMAALKTYLGGDFAIPTDKVQGQKPDVSDPVFKAYKEAIYKMCEDAGKLYDIEQFDKAAQLINYDNHRGLFDALSVRRSNGLLMWMSQSSWPSFMWQTYDYYLNGNGGFYGSKAGAQPTKAVFDPRTNEIIVANATPNLYEDVVVSVELYNLWGTLAGFREIRVNALKPDAYGVVIGKVDWSKSDTDVNFLRLRLKVPQEQPPLGVAYPKTLGTHTYWHNRKTYQDYRAIGAMPEPSLEVEAHPHEGNYALTDVTVRNAGNTPSVLTRLRLLDGEGNDCLPAFWTDNYVTIFPSEAYTVSVEFNNPEMKPLHVSANAFSVRVL